MNSLNTPTSNITKEYLLYQTNRKPRVSPCALILTLEKAKDIDFTMLTGVIDFALIPTSFDLAQIQMGRSSSE
jgi:hypothetical protein